MAISLPHSLSILFNTNISKFIPRLSPRLKHRYSKTSSRAMKEFLIHKKAFLKPELDNQDYRFIELPNKLKVLLIHDPDTDQSAASLDVNIGSFEDPNELPGLAHFCEHLLFMGSEKFPDENEYSSYLSKHGGSSNAYTGLQNTNYYFNVNNANLYGALDRFSGFFTCPLFNNNSTSKEINAVDSENKKNLQIDAWRLYQLDKSLTNPKHPYYKFSTGNIKTLGDIPRSKNMNIRDKLLEFYHNFYSSNLMKLCILGREDLDTLSNWAYKLFKDIPNLNFPRPEYSDQRILTDEYLTKIIRVKPVKDLRKLEVSFKIPDMDIYWEYKPQHYLSHLIGHEGSGSLLSFLIERHWANELSTGAHTICKDNAIFSINIDLTEQGLHNYENVINSVFQYIEMLKHCLPHEQSYNELKAISEACFKFQQKGDPSKKVSSLSKLLEKEYIPVEYILSTSLLRKFDPNLIKSCLDELIPQNSRITIISKSIETDSIEKWYGTQYSVQNYTDKFLKKLENPGLNSNFHLPNPNKFISTNFFVNKLENIEPILEPILLRDDYIGKLWFKKDDRFWIPKGYIYISLKLKHTYSIIEHSVLTSLYIELIRDSLKDLIYDANVANLSISFSKTNQGLDLAISGYNEKLLILLTHFLDGIKTFDPNPSRFNIFKDNLFRKLNNHLYEVPYLQIGSIFNTLIKEKFWSTTEKLETLKKLKFKDLKDFVPLIYNELYYEILVHGNFIQDEAFKINNLVSQLSSTTTNDHLIRDQKLKSCIISPGKSYCYEVSLKDKENVNSCIQYIIQLGVYTEELSAKASLFAQLINEPCFDILRTQEQLGYVVFSSALDTQNTVNIRILIQSEYDSYYLESRIDSFLKKVGDKLMDMHDQEFEKHKMGLIRKLLQKYKNLKEEHQRFINSIYIGDYNFLNKERKAQIINQSSKEDIINLYQRSIISKEASKLTIHLRSQMLRDRPPDYPRGEVIKDASEFKDHAYLAPPRQCVKKFHAIAPRL